MDVEDVIIYLLSRKKRKAKRRYWIHPLLLERHSKGVFNNYFMDLQNYPDRFFNYTRMSIKSFDILLENIRNSITGTDTRMRACVTPKEKLTITLRYLATGCSIADLNHNFRIGYTTARNIIFEVCVAIWENMKQTTFPKMNAEKWIEKANGFNKNANYPNCVGAIDGKHIRVIKPNNSGSLYYNYKNYFSIVLLAVCDADYKFTYIDVGAYGKCSDSSIYKHSILYEKLNNKNLQLPKKSPIPSNGVPMPYVIVGDEAFGLSENLMRPYGGRSLTSKKRIFNYRLSRARRFIECTFGILANKWRIFHRPMDVRQEFAIAIIKACCVLHNYVRERDGYRFKDTLYVPPELEIPPGQPCRGSRSSASYRDLFADHFVNENPLEWQNRVVLGT